MSNECKASIRINDEDEGVAGFEVVAPIRSNRLLATDVPDIQFEPDDSIMIENGYDMMKTINQIGNYFWKY